MGWTTKAKKNYYYERKKAAYKFAKDYGALFGLKPKTATKRIIKQFGKEYKLFKKNTAKINRLDRQINRLTKKSKLSKKDNLKLKSLSKAQAKLVVRTNQRWNEYQNKIGFKSAGEVDDSRRKY